jgi:amino acid transporter
MNPQPMASTSVDPASENLATSTARQLGVWDAVSIIVGIVVGTAIFRSPTQVFQNVSGPWAAYGVWLLGGFLSLCGAYCYAELATTFPRNGGDYEYLTLAFGRWLGFLFGWAQLTVVLSGSIASMAYAFGDYAVPLLSLPPGATVWVAATAVVALSVVNLLGLVVGKAAQNVLSSIKVLGLAAVAVAGLSGGGNLVTEFPASRELMGPGLGLAMVFVLYAYGGWNDAAYVAAEVRDTSRNLPRSLLIGIAGVTGIYLLINAAYLNVLGFDAARETVTPAADVLRQTTGVWGAKAISVLVMISALGAINGMVLTGSRIYASMGTDHALFAWLGRWNHSTSAPVTALLAQCGISLLLILAVGTRPGQATLDAMLFAVGLSPLPWAEYYGGFETLVAGTAPVFWAFFLMTGISLFVLRWLRPREPRPFPVPLYPLPAIIFCGTCVYMLYASLDYARWLALLGVVPLLAGVPLYWFSERATPAATPNG